MNHHKPAPATAVMAMDITTDSEISFAHSQYDNALNFRSATCRAASIPGNIGKRQCSLCQSKLGHQSPFQERTTTNR